jgi:hypothetical protein
MLAGEVDRVRAREGRAFSLRLNGGAIVQMTELDWQFYREISLVLWGTNGKLEILNGGLVNYFIPRREHRALVGQYELFSEERVSMPTTLGESFYDMYENLAAVLRGDGELVSPGENAQRVMEIVEQISQESHG